MRVRLINTSSFALTLRLAKPIRHICRSILLIHRILGTHGSLELVRSGD